MCKNIVNISTVLGLYIVAYASYVLVVKYSKEKYT